MARQMPCPDCGSPVRPDVDQLCPNCGYPLMFLRQQTLESEPRAVPRSPNEPATGIYQTRGYTSAPPQVYQGPGIPCPGCGYPNEQQRIRCERCGRELRAARPQPVRLAPPPVAPPDRRWLVVLLIVLGVLAVLSIASAVVAYLYF